MDHCLIQPAWLPLVANLRRAVKKQPKRLPGLDDEGHGAARTPTLARGGSETLAAISSRILASTPGAECHDTHRAMRDALGRCGGAVDYALHRMNPRFCWQRDGGDKQRRKK